uniref:Uncharacterized protein n=1 Tax=Setaria italica TaxID=4555 RepID=K4APJ4_SETIT
MVTSQNHLYLHNYFLKFCSENLMSCVLLAPIGARCDSCRVGFFIYVTSQAFYPKMFHLPRKTLGCLE